MEERKFNIGDEVIKLNLDYFDNPYHYQKCVESGFNVVDCNDRYFSIYGKNANVFSTHHDQRSQIDGIGTFGREKVYHKEKDKDLILQEINDAISKYDEFCKENDNKRKQFLLDKIERAKKEIEEIDKGNGNWKIGFSIHSNKEYKSKVIQVINSKLNFNL